MHKTVHIAVNMNEGLYYDISAIGPPSEALKPKEVEESITTVGVGVCDDAVKPRHRTQKGVRQWKSRFRNVARLQISHIKGKYNICNSSGSLVEQMNVNYYPEYNTKEKRDAKAIEMYAHYETNRDLNVRWYHRAMRDWRKVRRQWEIGLIENEWMHRQNYALFHPGLTSGTIRAAIALAKEDN